MDKAVIVNIILGILALIISFISYYFYIKAKINAAASGAIDDAERPGDGPNKLEEATDQAYALVPSMLKPFINRQLVKSIVQAAFNRIENYAKKQEKKPPTVPPPNE